MRESEFQEWLRQLAELNGWKYYHPHRSDHSAAGFPDTTLTRDGELIFAELKVGKNKPTAAQSEWLEKLSEVGGKVEVHLWYPDQRDVIEERLKRRRKPERVPHMSWLSLCPSCLDTISVTFGRVGQRLELTCPNCGDALEFQLKEGRK